MEQHAMSERLTQGARQPGARKPGARKAAARLPGASMAHHWARQMLFRICQKLEVGMLDIEDLTMDHQEQRYHFGEPERCGAKPVEVHYRASIQVRDERFYTLVLTGGTNGAAEAYMAGYWQTSNLVNLIRLMLANRAQMESLDGPLSSLASGANRVWHALNRNTEAGSRRNIAAHYDLGNDFFSQFLDSRLMYSSGIYIRGDETLEEASSTKLERICQKLDLSPQDHLLEIGTGWGGMAIYAAERFGCRVTTTTISQEQYDEAKARVEAAGLQGRITLLLEDYRKLEGEFDKVVSIEMVEAVGHQYLDQYFEKIAGLLKPDGMALIQAITIDDNHYERALREVDFIKRYIFPGSFIPCATVLASSAAKTGLRTFNLEDIGESYALTLRDWRERFLRALDTIREQGFDERFIRMWEFYLCYCEGGFRERAISNVQMLLTRSANRRAQWLPGS